MTDEPVSAGRSIDSWRTERARHARRTQTFAAPCAASSGERRSPGDASREGPKVPRPARAATPREDTTGSEATEEHGSKRRSRFVITRERRSLGRQRVPGSEATESPRAVRAGRRPASRSWAGSRRVPPPRHNWPATPTSPSHTSRGCSATSGNDRWLSSSSPKNAERAACTASRSGDAASGRPSSRRTSSTDRPRLAGGVDRARRETV